MQPTGLSRTPSTLLILWVFLSRHASKYRSFYAFLNKSWSRNKFSVCYLANNIVRHSHLIPYVRQYTADWPEGAFLVLHLNNRSFYAFLNKSWSRNKFCVSYLAPDFVRCNPQASHVRQVRYEPCGFFFLIMHLNIAVFMRFWKSFIWKTNKSLAI